MGSNIIGYYIIENYDKGYLLLGNKNYNYCWIIKTDINGNQLWDIKIGDGSYNCVPSDIEQTMDDGFIISGSMSKYDPSKADPFIIKFNKCGEMEWCKVLNYPGNTDYGQSVKCTPDGGYVLLTFNYSSEPDRKIHLFKFNSLGDLTWQKNYIRDSLAFGDYIRKLFTDTTNFLVTGFCYYPNPGQPGGWIRPYYIQTDTSGNEQWQLVYSKNIGLGYIGEAWATIKGINNDYYSSGRREGSPELIKFSTSGNEIYNSDLFPSADGGNATTITALNDSILILCAGWVLSGGPNYLAFIKTDTSGNIRKIGYLPDPENSAIYWSAKTFDNKILGIGTNSVGSNSRIVLNKVNSDLENDTIYTQPFTYDSLCPDSITSKTIDPNCDLAVDIGEPDHDPQTIQIKVFPNPAQRVVTVVLPKYIMITNEYPGLHSATLYYQWQSTTLEVYDLSGKQILSRIIPKNIQQTDMDVSQWPKGIYYFRLTYNNRTVTGAKLIVN
ncbi:MAG TPA: T9SS type A sorting domain-containing protein [Bacteroidales bacterium]|nr:T9SS type A sorting domain-containing protein [Bacteroidales bacterium]